jgi:hypothetical protein
MNLSCVVCFVLTLNVSTGMAMQKPDFSGTWTLDKSRSEGIPPSLEQTVKVVQSGDRIDVETKSVSDQGEQTINSSYTLDGKEAEVTLPGPMPGLTAKGKQTAKWSTDGNGFESEDVGTFDTPYGPATIKTKRAWRLSADGKTLTIELTREGPISMKSKRVFVKKVS